MNKKRMHFSRIGGVIGWYRLRGTIGTSHCDSWRYASAIAAGAKASDEFLALKSTVRIVFSRKKMRKFLSQGDHDFATLRRWNDYHERPNMTLDGLTLNQRLAMSALFLFLTTAKNGESPLKIKSCCLKARKRKMAESYIGESGAPWQLQRLQLRERLEMDEASIGEVAAVR